MASNDPRNEGQEKDRGHDFVTGEQTGSVGGKPETGDPWHGVQDRAGQMASAVAATAEHTWDRARRSIGDMSSQVGSEAEHLWQSMISCMRAYPLAVFFTGVGVGFVLSQMMKEND